MCICLQGYRAWFENSVYDANEGRAKVFKGIWRFKRESHTYLVEPDDVFPLKRFRHTISACFVDVNARKSLSVKELLDKKIDMELAIELEVLAEKKYYESNLEAMYPLRYLIIALLGGMGVYAVVRMLLSTAGYYIP